MHDLRVADQLDRDELQRPPDVVVARRVVVPLDRGEDESIDRADVREGRGDLSRTREIERHRLHLAQMPCAISAVRAPSRPVMTTGRRLAA